MLIILNNVKWYDILLQWYYTLWKTKYAMCCFSHLLKPHLCLSINLSGMWPNFVFRIIWDHSNLYVTNSQIPHVSLYLVKLEKRDEDSIQEKNCSQIKSVWLDYSLFEL